jgi:hypothetical protein
MAFKRQDAGTAGATLRPGARAAFLLAGVSLAWLGCGAGISNETDTAATAVPPDAGSTSSTDGATSGDDGETGTWTCGAAAPTTDLCAALPRGSVAGCADLPNGEPSQSGYLDITMPDGSHVYTCATAWSDEAGGYWFDAPDAFMADPQSCCGAAPTPIAIWDPPPFELGTLGALHGPREIKPQESAGSGAGLIRTNPFAVIVRDQAAANLFATAFADWQAWAGDGNAHAGSDGTGAYYFAAEFPVNFAIVETPDGQPVLIIAPEVSLTPDGMTPLGHPTLGACADNGGAPLVLMAGEVWGTTITNHSGRFNHHPAVTQEALENAVKLFNCFGIAITRTTYYPPTI